MRVQFAYEVAALPDHIDELGHVNHKVYVAWAEEAGVRHWRASATIDLQTRYVWVASRLEMDFRRETRLGDRLRVETWLGEVRGARYDRHVRILGVAGDLRAEARTVWALIDAASRRPVRVPAELLAVFPPADLGDPA